MHIPFISGYPGIPETVFPGYVSGVISYRESPARIVPPPYADTYGTPPLLPESSLSAAPGSAGPDDGIRECRVADIFRGQGEQLLRSGMISPQQAKAVSAIMHCRTETYGYHADICDE